MEENLQTIKGDSGNQEPPLKKVINDIDGKEGKTIIRNENLQDPNNEIVEEENFGFIKICLAFICSPLLSII